MVPDAIILVFWMLSFKPALSLSSFTLIKRLFSSSSLSAIRVYHLPIWDFWSFSQQSVCDSSSPAFHMMYSTYNLNQQGGNIQPWHTPFQMLSQSVVPCLVLTVAFWPTYWFLRRKVRCSDILISLRTFQFVMIHTVKVFTAVNEKKQTRLGTLLA